MVKNTRKNVVQLLIAMIDNCSAIYHCESISPEVKSMVLRNSICYEEVLDLLTDSADFNVKWKIFMEEEEDA